MCAGACGLVGLGPGGACMFGEQALPWLHAPLPHSSLTYGCSTPAMLVKRGLTHLGGEGHREQQDDCRNHGQGELHPEADPAVALHCHSGTGQRLAGRLLAGRLEGSGGGASGSAGGTGRMLMHGQGVLGDHASRLSRSSHGSTAILGSSSKRFHYPPGHREEAIPR